MGYIEHLLILICIYIILAVSLNLITGFAGLLNLGHAAFFGIGAYTSALLTIAGVPFPPAFTASSLLAGISGLLISLPCIRLRGDYLAIATLGFGEIIRSVMKNWTSLTRGPLGIPGIPQASFGIVFDTQLKFLVFSLLVMFLTIVLVRRITHSSYGRLLRAVREDEVAAQSLGKNIISVKITVMVLGAALAGIAGSLYAHYITFIDPMTFTFTETVTLLVMVILGGVGSIRGSIIGAIILVLLPEPLRWLHLPSSVVAAIRQLIYAALLIVLLLLKPQGLFAEKKHEVNLRDSRA